ncbi:MAG: hypothetical protein ABW208_22245 [Pyrinomonadaceae bacterium]
MSKRADPINETDKLVSRLSKRPLWAAAGTLFMASLYFMGTVFWDLNEQNANIAKFNSLAHTYQMDGRKAATITATLNLVWGAAVEAASHFSSNIEASNNTHSITDDVLGEGLGLIHECRNGINTEISVLSTLHFDDQGFTQYVEGFQKDLEALDQMLATKELIYNLLGEKKHAEAETELKKLKTDPAYLRERQFQTALLRVRAFQNIAERKREEYAAELDLQKARIDSFRVKVYLLLPVAGYAGAFAVIAIKRWKRAVAKKTT